MKLKVAPNTQEQHRRDAAYVREKILNYRADEVFAQTDPADPRVYMLFKSEDGERNYIFYTGVVIERGQAHILNEEGHDYTNTRLLHNARVRVRLMKGLDITLGPTRVVEDGEANDYLKAIAVNACNDRTVKTLGAWRFKKRLESATELRDEKKQPLIR